MGKAGALGVSDQGDVLDQICDRRRRPLDGLGGCGHMLDPFLARLEEVGEIGHAEGIEVGILGGDGEALVACIGGAVSLQAVAGLEAVDPAIAAARCVHGRGQTRVLQQREWGVVGAVGGISSWRAGRVMRAFRAAAAQWDVNVMVGPLLLLPAVRETATVYLSLAADIVYGL